MVGWLNLRDSKGANLPSASVTQRRIHWVLVLLLTVFAVAPLSYPGFFQSETGLLPVYNLLDLQSHWGDLQWWPAVGASADVLRGDGPLAYYLALALLWFGLNAPAAVRATYALAFVSGAWGFYGWAQRHLGAAGGTIAAVVYTYLPFRLAAVYVHGAPGQSLVWAIIPWLLWTMESMEERWSRHGLGVLFFVVALLLAQPGLALWALAFAVALTFSGSRLQRTVILLLVGLSGGGLLLWPAYRTHGLTAAPLASFAQGAVWPYQLLAAQPGEGLQTLINPEGSAWQIGVVALGLAVLGLVFLSTPVKTEVSLHRRAWSYVGVGLALIVLTLPPLIPLWSLTRLDRTLAAPGQLLGFVGLLLAWLAGLLVKAEPRLEHPAWLTVLIGLVILAVYPTLSPRFFNFQRPLDPEGHRIVDFTPAGLPPAIFGENQIVLVGSHVEGRLSAGQVVTVTVLWQALRPVDHNYTVFLHVVDQAGKKWGQHDGQPLDGSYPTSRWRQGEIIQDQYVVTVDPQAGNGPLALELGWYLLETGERLPIQGQEASQVVIYGR